MSLISFDFTLILYSLFFQPDPKTISQNSVKKEKIESDGDTPSLELDEKVSSLSREETLKIYNKIDIGLDPFPFQGNTTTCEAVWMGVPVLTLKGNRYLFHFGESINSNLNMEDWIAENEEEYISKAVKFSTNIKHLSEIRNNLRQTALNSPVFDSLRFSDHLSSMLWRIWDEFENKK